MVIHRIKALGTYLFLIAIGYCLVSLPVYATSRGILVKVKTSSGSRQQIQLYSGYHALIVGCSDYRVGWPSLPNPVKDAMEVASLFKSMGWTVDFLENPGGATLRRELNKLVAGPGRNREKAILLWFSGHGQTIEEADGAKLGYLVPVDAPDPDKDFLGFLERAISMRQIETVSKQIRSKHVLMVFDSCFSGAIFQMVRARPSPYIQEKVSYPVRQFITAGREDEQVPDKSVFKDVFIQSIKDGFADLNQDSYITGEELGSYLQEKVTNYSRKAQHPQFGKINNPKLDKGDFVFVRKSPIQFSQSDRIPSDLETEEKRLVEQAAQVELERRELEAERHRLEAEKKTLAYIPKKVKVAKDSLRKEPQVLIDRDIKNMLEKYYFFDKDRNPLGNFVNDFIVDQDGTITDRVTGLIWQKSGSERELLRLEATRYVKDLNKERFAGYSDWRLPTIEELASLLIRNKNQGLYINSFFDSRQKKCWSVDSLPEDNITRGYQKDWIINFVNGHITYARWIRKAGPAWLSWYIKDNYNYVRAVRSSR
jgi:hypothetical protein